MVVLALGDIVGEAGSAYLREKLPGLKRYYKTNVVMANGENCAQGNGITPKSARYLFDSGVDVITTGNHVFRRREIYETLDEQCGIIRPANFHRTSPGVGQYIYDGCRYKLCVINLVGVYGMHPSENPFDCIDRILEKIDTPNIIVDFHAEATSEKQCMGYYLDGRVSAVLGTHTHIPTADARILSGGTGYITDLGMCGGMNSSLGVKADDAIKWIRTGMPVKFEEENKDIRICAVVLDIDEQSGRCKCIEQLAWI